MITTGLLYQVLLLLGLLLSAALAAVFGHAAWLGWTRRADPPRLALARAALTNTLAGGAAPASTVPRGDAARTSGEGPAGSVPADRDIVALPDRLRRRLLSDLAGSVQGDQRQRLARLAVDLGIIGRAQRWARSRWWWRRLRGAHLLSSLCDEDPLMHRLLGDPHPAVRAEAITWAGDHVDTAVAERLVDLLADRSPLCRHAAKDALLRAGPAAPPVVAEHLRRGDSPNLDALLDVAAGRPDHRYQAAARSLAGDPRPAIRAVAARLLGELGGHDAIPVLELQLTDPQPAVREEAAAALGRLGHWPAASAVARLLRDPSWDVRCAAGEALAALGAPGALMLQRYSRDDDPFAADMARRVQQSSGLRTVGAREPAR
jgi:hypothetical protein